MGSSDESESSKIVQQKSLKIVTESTISSVALLADGQHFVSGDGNGKIRRWRVEDGEEVGAQIDAESAVCCLATSQDGKWIVTGAESGRVTVGDAKSRKEMSRFEREKEANSVDISWNGTKVGMARNDKYVGVSSLPDGTGLWGRKDCDFHTVKFSPDGLLFAVGSEDEESSFLCIYEAQSGKFRGSSRISTRSVAWTSDSKRLFALSSDGDISCIDPYSQATLSQWPIHSNDNPTCISLSSNGAFIAASANSSVSFWDTSTQEQIGSVLDHPHSINSMAISANNELVFTGNSTILLWDLRNVLPVPYIQQVGGSSFSQLRPLC